MAQDMTDNADAAASQAVASEAAASETMALPSYEQTLIDLAKRDAERAIENPDERATRSVALWMADQVTKHSQRSELDPAFARVMQEQAKRIREKVLAAPQSRVAKRW